MTYEIEECDRQLILRGLAVQSLRSPGFTHACGEISKVFHGEEMFNKFRQLLEDVEPAR